MPVSGSVPYMSAHFTEGNGILPASEEKSPLSYDTHPARGCRFGDGPVTIGVAIVSSTASGCHEIARAARD
jgi:hypothetical protein